MSAATTAVPFGTAPDGRPVTLYTLRRDDGATARVMDWGATVVSLQVPDALGHVGEVILGFDTLDDYLAEQPYLGAVVGRYANRIAHGRFDIGGTTHQLACNNGAHHLHGGLRGLDKRLWQAEARASAQGPQVVLRYRSPDGEEGYPGQLDIEVTYTLAEGPALCIDYRAQTDRATPVNLSNHMYFNLAGRGTVLDHRLRIAASHFLPVEAGLIPTGEPASVENTPMDFRDPHAVGPRLAQTDAQLALAGGFDHNWVLDHPADGCLHLAATLHEPTTSRTMTVLTTQPGMQFYSGHLLDGTLKGHGGQPLWRHAGLCLETQHFPDSPNRPRFPGTVLVPGQVYLQRTVYRFD